MRRDLFLASRLLMACWTVLGMLAAGSVSSLSSAATAAFDFDTGSPTLLIGQNTPFDQTSGGVTASFSSPSDPGIFSVQNQDTTFLILSQFSGNYLYDNKLPKQSLHIGFSQQLTSISLTFATTDYHGPGDVEVPSDVKLTAYMNSKGTTPVGSATTHGSFSSDSFPQGRVSFDSGGQAFNLVEIEIILQPKGGTDFFVDNITVTTVNPIPAHCFTWADVITKYSDYVTGNAGWSDVIICYQEYAASGL